MITQSSRLLNALDTKLLPCTLFQKVESADWLVSLQKGVASLKILQNIFNQECPLELTGQCFVSGIKEHCLTLVVDNGGIASKLQYRTRELVRALRQYPEYSGLKRIFVRIVPANFPAKQLETVSASMSPEVAELFEQVAEGISDPELKQSVLKFARWGHKK